MFHFFTFFNFGGLIPGEVIPYGVFHGRVKINLVFIFLCAMVVLFGFKFVFFVHGEDALKYLINFIEVIAVLFFIFFAKNMTDRKGLRWLSIVCLSFLILGILCFYFPEVNSVKSRLVARTFDSSAYILSQRGMPLLASEPSYAGMWMLGFALLFLQQGYRPGIIISGCGVIVTLSLWTLSCALLFGALIVLRKSRVVVLFTAFTIAFLIFVGLDFGIFSINSDLRALRFASRLIEHINQAGFLDGLIEVEKSFGSVRLWPTLEAVFTYSGFENERYQPVYGLFPQIISLFGSVVGFILIVSILLLLYRSGRDIFLAAIICSIAGPTPLLPIYLVLTGNSGERNN